jgi:hypothetical protein
VKYFAFKTGFFDLLVHSNEVTEFHVDSTYKTNRAGFELFGVVANVYGSGYPVGYLIVKIENVPQSGQASARIDTLKLFFQTMKNQGLNPTFMFCDKDVAEIRAVEETWQHNDHPIVRLCLWHQKRAIKFKLSQQKTAILPIYDPAAAHLEFDFVDATFIPVHDNRRQRRHLLTSVLQRNTILEMIGKHYNMHNLIPDGKKKKKKITKNRNTILISHEFESSRYL